MKNIIKKNKFIAMILISMLAALINAIAVKELLTPIHVVPLGVPGLAYLIETFLKNTFSLHITYYTLYFGITILISLWAYKYVSKLTTIKTLVYMLFFTLFSKYIPQFHITDDKLLSTIFGGFANALASVMVLYVGSTIGAYSLIGLFFSRKYNRALVGKINLGITIVIIIAYCFITNLENGMYSLLLTAISSFLVDKWHIQSGYLTLLIITNEVNKISEYTNSVIKRTATIIESSGSYSRSENNTLLLTLSKVKLNTHIRNLKIIDPKIHISVIETKRVIGNMKNDIGKTAL